MSQQFCLKWNNHMNNMMDVFKNLLSTESMVDVTLACDGLSLKAHKMVLSACSPFFQALFLENPCQHPIVILKDMKYTELKAIIEFMYHGEVNVAQDQLSALMKTAETLRVKGLAEVTNEKSQSASQDDSRQSRSDTPPPHSKRRKVRNRKRSLSGSDYSDSEREPKIKQSASPDIEELSGDISLDNTSSGQFSNVQQTRVPMQSHSSNSYHKTSSVASSQDLHMEGTSENESEFGVEPAKLLQQSLTTEDARRNRLSTLSTSSEPQRRPKSSTDHSMGMSIVPTPLPSDDNSQQQPLSPPDIKPELLELDPPMSPVAGTSHGSENAMVVYGDPGPSSYQDNSALVPQDSQQQESYFYGSIPGVTSVYDDSIINNIKAKCRLMCGSKKLEFPGSHPVLMNRDNIKLLTKKPYKVSWISRGTRYMLLIEGKNKIYFIDGENSVFKVHGLSFPSRRDPKKHITNTLIDGVLVTDKVKGKNSFRYLAHDIIIFEDMDVGKRHFNTRLLCLNKEIVNVRRTAFAEGRLDRMKEPFSVGVKGFWDITKAKQILGENFSKQMSHKVDGLVFQPLENPYMCGRCEDILKWGPSNQSSIRFKLSINTQSGLGLLPTKICDLYVGGKKEPFAQMKCTPSLKTLDKKIIECKYEHSQWIFMRERTDKSFPDEYQTASDVFESKRNGVTREELFYTIDLNC